MSVRALNRGPYISVGSPPLFKKLSILVPQIRSKPVMSKLPKAPLIEVIFEIKWKINGPEESREAQYLHGDLYQLLKERYPHRETVNPHVPVELLLMNMPTHRFRAAPNDYPLVQVGPGIVAVNTIDSKYFWDDYESRIMEVLRHLKEVYQFKHHHNVQLILQFIDLLRFDFSKSEVLDYLEEYLNISIKQQFYTASKPKNVALALNFPTDQGTLSVNIGRGKDVKGHDGISVQTVLNSGVVKPNLEFIKGWLEKSHEICSVSFKKMTKGKLYDSFK